MGYDLKNNAKDELGIQCGATAPMDKQSTSIGETLVGLNRVPISKNIKWDEREAPAKYVWTFRV
ncbi:MAG: hypothetical protein ALECFALPRED_007938 [Alectoria fallacina]|uniref:Uncharacterized protein n=1 Tax=Alectoria fallacina TaxID=1903189 RepID=A0A8H3J1M0_9LECA|nr:MAG: hypothetical protein ALECFALPRED_007938 [Alectoria fallacina]